MKRALLVALFLMQVVITASASDKTTISSRRDDGRIIYTADKRKFGTQTVYLNFRDLSNANYTNMTPELISYSGNFLTLVPEREDKHITHNGMTYRVFSGAVGAKSDTTLRYRLPFGVGKSGRVVKLNNIMDPFYKKQEEVRQLNYSAYGFVAQRGDTVYTTRRGVVVNIVTKTNDSELATTGKLSFSSKRPIITIEHSDGSQGVYSPLSPDKIFVEEGDQVECGDPLGIVGTFDNKHFQIRFWLYCYVKNPHYSWESDPNKTPIAIRKYIDPIFVTTTGDTNLKPRSTYTAVMDDGLYIQDMSRRQRIKWGKARGLSKREVEKIVEKKNR